MKTNPTDDLFNEVREERAAIRQFDGLMDRAEAERLGLLDAEAWRHACEVRHILSLRSVADRRAYLDRVASSRGRAAADVLGDAVRQAWMARKVKSV